MTEKCSVLIADDELPIRQELINFPWEKNGFVLVGAARNGKEALEMASHNSCPDIVVTDITMPVMDGMELIAHLKKSSPQIKFIILTCHQDFEYAKQAIKHNVVDYLIKSDLSEEAIIASLNKAVTLIREEEVGKQNTAQEKRRRLAGLIAAGRQEHGVIQAELERLGFDLRGKTPHVFVMVENRLQSWIFVELAIHEFFNRYALVKNWTIVDNGCYYMQLQTNVTGAIEDFILALRKMVQEKFPFAMEIFFLYAVVPKKQSDLSGFMDCLSRIGIWKSNHFYQPGSAVLYESLPVCKSLSAGDSAALLSIFRTGESTAAAREFASWAAEHMLYPGELKRVLLVCMRQNKLDDFDGAAEFFDKIEHAFDIDELVMLLQSCIAQRASQFGRYEIRKAVQIINQEYSKEISLASIAELVNLSPPYLSRLFSEVVGEGIGDYITRVRMEQAQKLMRGTDMKIYQIAEAVGIPNYRYFSTLFKKFTGKTSRDLKNGGGEQR